MDMDLVCACGSGFVWTAGEQRFMQSLLEDGKISELRQPKRCGVCRAKKKAEREARGE